MLERVGIVCGVGGVSSLNKTPIPVSCPGGFPPWWPLPPSKPDVDRARRDRLGDPVLAEFH